MLKADSAHYWSSDSSMHHKYCVQVCEATSTQTCCLSKYTHLHPEKLSREHMETGHNKKYISGQNSALSESVCKSGKVKSYKTLSVFGCLRRKYQLGTSGIRIKHRVTKENMTEQDRVLQSSPIAFSLGTAAECVTHTKGVSVEKQMDFSCIRHTMFQEKKRLTGPSERSSISMHPYKCVYDLTILKLAVAVIKGNSK